MPGFAIPASRCSEKTRTREWFAEWGVTCRPAAPGELRHAQRAREAADVADVRLDHVHDSRLDHPTPHALVPVLLAAGHVELERRGHLPGPVELPVRARLLEVGNTVLLEHVPDLDRSRGRVAAVRVDEERGVVTEPGAYLGDESVRTTRPLVLVVAALPSDPHLEGLESVCVAEPGRAVSASSSGVMSRRMLEA